MSSVTFREEVFAAFVSDENNPLKVPDYVRFFERFIREEQGIEDEYDRQIQ